MTLRQADASHRRCHLFAICAANGEVWSRCRLGSASHCSSSEYCDGIDRSAAGEAPERPIWPLRQRTAVSALVAIEVYTLAGLVCVCYGSTGTADANRARVCMNTKL